MSTFCTIDGRRPAFVVAAILAAALLPTSVRGDDAASTEAGTLSLFVAIPLKPGTIDGFLPVMLDNAYKARGEDGCISFDVFQDEEGGDAVYLFERWRDQAALDAHMKQPHLLKALERVKADRDGEVLELRLSEAPPAGGDARTPVADPSKSRNIVIVQKVKPESRDAFLAALAETIPQARSQPGCRCFELYQDRSDADVFVLFERWDDADAHAAHRARDYSKKFGEIVPQTYAQPRSRHVLKDVAGR